MTALTIRSCSCRLIAIVLMTIIVLMTHCLVTGLLIPTKGSWRFFRPQEAKCVLILQLRIGQSSRAYSSTPDDGDYGQSYLGGQDVCGSKCNTDPFDIKHKPDPWLTLKSRIDAIVEKNRRDLYLKSSNAVDRVDTAIKKDEYDVKGSGRWLSTLLPYSVS
jgi:hypothetical protein